MARRGLGHAIKWPRPWLEYSLIALPSPARRPHRLARQPARGGAGCSPRSGAILRVADVFQPVDDLAVERFRNRDVRPRYGWRRAVPVLLAGPEPNDIARLDLL